MYFFALVYTFIVLVYLWYRYGLWGASTGIKQKNESKEKVSVIIPSYNEDPSALQATLESVIEAENVGEIFLVDDGSKNLNDEKMQTVLRWADSFGVKIILCAENRGKRHVQLEAFKLVKYKYIATIDSDTTVEPDAFKIGVSYLQSDLDTGAVTGLVRARNRKHNWLTRMIDARYVNAFLFERRSLSNVGIVTCCCGSMSIYRTSFIKLVMDDYVNQQFLGKNQNFGDDRHLTNLAIMNGWKVKMLDDMIAYTDVPIQLNHFIKQQTRWSQSFIRENIILLEYAVDKSWLLTWELMITSVIPFLALPARVLLIILCIQYPVLIIPTLISIITMATLRNLWLIEEKKIPDKFAILFYNIGYAFIHFAITYWLFFIALYKVFVQKNTKWGTRITTQVRA